MPVLSAIGTALLLCAAAALLTGNISTTTFYGILALAYALLGIQKIRENDWLMAFIDSALCALYTRWWWNGGGGDNTRRRLRSLARRFQPVRRTAPQAA